MKRHPVIYRILEIIPLAIFLLHAETIDLSNPKNWLGPYVTSSIAAIVSTIILLRLKSNFNPLFIGINLYLISGSIGLITNLTWLNTLYGDLQAAGMLAWIVLVGLYCLNSYTWNFLGARSINKQITFNYSIVLLGISIAACIMSYSFQSNKILSEYAPFIILFSTQTYFKIKAEQHPLN